MSLTKQKERLGPNDRVSTSQGQPSSRLMQFLDQFFKRFNDNIDETVHSEGTTGGSGSAGAGNQHVEMTINGTTYKVLHDGTV